MSRSADRLSRGLGLVALLCALFAPAVRSRGCWHDQTLTGHQLLAHSWRMSWATPLHPSGADRTASELGEAIEPALMRVGLAVRVAIPLCALLLLVGARRWRGPIAALGVGAASVAAGTFTLAGALAERGPELGSVRLLPTALAHLPLAAGAAIGAALQAGWPWARRAGLGLVGLGAVAGLCRGWDLTSLEPTSYAVWDWQGTTGLSLAWGGRAVVLLLVLALGLELSRAEPGPVAEATPTRSPG